MGVILQINPDAEGYQVSAKSSSCSALESKES
jgi:hypothetical protein